MNFAEARAQFPVLDRIAYLNAGSMGPLAQVTVEAMAAREQADLERGRGGRPYIDEMLALRRRVRSGLAGTIGVPAENVALTASTTEACNIVLAGLRLGPEDEVVTTDTEHFGLLGPLQASGARIRVARIRNLPVEEALEAYTRDGAWLAWADDSVGTLEAGKFADLVVLGGDPTAVAAEAIPSIPVLQTIVGGVPAFGEGPLTV